MRLSTWAGFGAGVGIMLAVVSACRGSADPPPNLGAASVTVVNLNAAMGFRLASGDPGGTDATPEDITLLADDILKQHADIVNLQEMAIDAAHELREYLTGKTGAEWQMNWAHSSFATYWPGREDGEAPAYEDVSAGNAQLVRIGNGIRGQRPITVDGDRPYGHEDQGMLLPTSPKPDDKGHVRGGRSFQGTEITTEHGSIDVYNAHLALARDHSDDERARDVEYIQRFTESRTRTNPAIITGDFNQEIDGAPVAADDGRPQPPHLKTVTALVEFMRTYGYTDVAKDMGPTSNRQPDKEIKKLVRARIDYILARGVGTRNTARFESHESDHWGLVTTVEPSSERVYPTLTPTSGVSASPVPPSPQERPTVPEAFHGLWRSPEPVRQPSSSLTYYVQITLWGEDEAAGKDIVGLAEYNDDWNLPADPKLSCNADLRLVSSGPNEIVVSETVKSDLVGNCGDQGRLTLTVTGDQMAYSYEGGGLTATATLNRE